MAKRPQLPGITAFTGVGAGLRSRPSLAAYYALLRQGTEIRISDKLDFATWADRDSCGHRRIRSRSATGPPPRPELARSVTPLLARLSVYPRISERPLPGKIASRGRRGSAMGRCCGRLYACSAARLGIQHVQSRASASPQVKGMIHRSLGSRIRLSNCANASASYSRMEGAAS
jgi:hypothetical protein